MRNPGTFRWFISESEGLKILRAYPQEHARFIAEADQVLGGEVQIQGYGRRPLYLDPRAETSINDPYPYKLLSRLDFLVPLYRAARLSSGKDDYLKELKARIREWELIRSSPYDWDSVDDAIRILNLLETLVLMRSSLPEEIIRSGLGSILHAAWNIETTRTRAGNHLIYEGLALLVVGLCLPEHPRAGHWKRLGRRLLEKQMHRQVRPEGMNGELSTNYHLITGTNFLKAWILSAKFDKRLSNSYRRRLAKMAGIAWQLRAADGGFLSLGDSDRMAGSSREEKEGRAFARLGELLGAENSQAKSDFDLSWLLAGIDLQQIAAPDELPQNEIVCFGGYSVLRDAEQLVVFDAGPFGLPGASHHGHADSLSFEVHLSGKRFLTDPGSFSYFDAKARSYARSTAAHNTIRIDGQDSSLIIGRFSYGRTANAKYLIARRFPDGYLLVGEHDGYSRLPSPVIHRRALLWLTGAPFRLLVFDRLEGSGRHELEAFFHAETGWEAYQTANSHLIWKTGEQRIMQMFRANEAVNIRLAKGQLEPEWQGWVAPSLENYLPATTLIIQSSASMPWELVSIFIEMKDKIPEASFIGANIFTFDEQEEITWNWRDEKIELRWKSADGSKIIQ